MAKMTISGLQTFVNNYVAAAKQAGTWTASTNNIYSLQDKIGKQITLDGLVGDKLPEMDGDELPLGKTIEEYFADFVLPQNFDDTGASTMAPATTPVENPSYSYTLGRKMIKVTERFDNVERAALTSADAANLLSKVTQRLYESEAIYKYGQKRQVIANAIAKAEAATNSSTLVQTLAVPTNTTTSEAFIKSIKEQAEVASDINEGNCLGNTLIGAAPELVLYVKQGVIPTIEVDALAGAFNQDRLAMPVKIKVIKDFGNNATGVYAVLADPRGMKLHNGYKAVRTQENAEGDFVNFDLHTENTAFISKFTFLHVYKG